MKPENHFPPSTGNGAELPQGQTGPNSMPATCTIAEAAALFQVTPETIRRLVEAKVLETTKPLPEPVFYTIPEAAAALNVCTKTVRRLLDRGLLTSSNALRIKLIPRQQIEEFLKKTCNKPKL